MPAQCVMPVLPLSVDDGPGLLGQGRVPDRLGPVGLGVLTGEVSPGLVDQVIELAGPTVVNWQPRTVIGG